MSEKRILTSENEDCLSDFRRRNDDKLRIKLPFVSAEINGKYVMILLAIAIICTPAMIGVYLHDEKMERQLTHLIDSQDATNYILTLSPEKRELLQLAKPKRIREMERVKE